MRNSILGVLFTFRCTFDLCKIFYKKKHFFQRNSVHVLIKHTVYFHRKIIRWIFSFTILRALTPGQESRRLWATAVIYVSPCLFLVFQRNILVLLEVYTFRGDFFPKDAAACLPPVRASQEDSAGFMPALSILLVFISHSCSFQRWLVIVSVIPCITGVELRPRVMTIFVFLCFALKLHHERHGTLYRRSMNQRLSTKILSYYQFFAAKPHNINAILLKR